MLRILRLFLYVSCSGFIMVSGFSRFSQRPITFPGPIGLARSIHMRSVDLSEVGNDIVLEPATDVKRIVMKFGGSSLATAERLTYVARLVQKHVEAGYKPVIVCSALGKTTNALLAAGDFALGGEISNDSIRTLHMATIKQLGLASNLHLKEDIDTLMREMEQLLQGVKYIGELSPRTLDALVSFGERMSVRIVAALLNKMGVPAQSFDSWALGLTTSSEFQDADVLDESYGKLKESLSKFEGFMVPIITGFIAHDKNGKITTLGRGGSDLTATVIGAAAEMDEIQVWKDVDGILTADPRVVTNAHPVEKVTYEEAAELAYFGAQVLHPISMQPAIRFKVPVRVKNSYNPSAVGTAIVAERDKMRTLVTALTSKNNVQLIDIVSTKMLGQYGFLAKVFNLFESYKISVDVVATSEVSVSLTLDRKQMEKRDVAGLLAELQEVASVTVVDGRAIVSLICNVDRSSEVLQIAFDVMQKEGISVEMLSQGASKVNISIVVAAEDKDRLIRALHDEFYQCGPDGMACPA